MDEIKKQHKKRRLQSMKDALNGGSVDEALYQNLEWNYEMWEEMQLLHEKIDPVYKFFQKFNTNKQFITFLVGIVITLGAVAGAITGIIMGVKKLF